METGYDLEEYKRIDTELAHSMELIEHLNIEVVSLKSYISELELRLKKYTNGENHKRYYEKNKEKIKETGSSYLQKLKLENPDKIKEYSHRAYINQKAKKKKKEEEGSGLETISEASVSVSEANANVSEANVSDAKANVSVSDAKANVSKSDAKASVIKATTVIPILIGA
jgi:hypothetical protein